MQPKILIIDNGTTYLKDLEKLFANHNYTVVKLNDIGAARIKPGTLVVLSGGHTFPVIWHNKYYAKELALICNYTGPILGICLGFELIAHAYGNHLSFLPRRVKLERVIKVNEVGKRYFSVAQFNAYESHRYALRRAQHPLIPLATTKGDIEIIRHQTRPIFAVQFHPEKLQDEQGKVVFREILKAIDILNQT